MSLTDDVARDMLAVRCPACDGSGRFYDHGKRVRKCTTCMGKKRILPPTPVKVADDLFEQAFGRRPGGTAR